jgi:hypothetical protein
MSAMSPVSPAGLVVSMSSVGPLRSWASIPLERGSIEIVGVDSAERPAEN